MPAQFKEIGKGILLTLAVGGAITLTAVSPRFAALLLKQISKKLDPNLKKAEERKKFSQALYRLKRSRLIITKEMPNGTFVLELTEKGKRKTKMLKFDDLKIEKPKKWDGIWRIVIFDIPNKKTNAREALRNKLNDLGFYQLQKSVFVFPYPCDKEIEFITEFFGLYPYINRIEAKSIKNDVFLKKHYHLF